MSLATGGIHCMIGLYQQHLSGTTEDCSIVRGRQPRMLCRQMCCMSASQRMFGSLWNAVADVLFSGLYRTLRPQNTSAPAPKCLRKSRDTSDPGQFRRDTSVLVQKCLKTLLHQILEKAGHFGPKTVPTRHSYWCDSA